MAFVFYFKNANIHANPTLATFMAKINEIRRETTLKVLKQLKDNYGIERKDFAELADINYNLLNQYLSDKGHKNIGAKTAAAITAPLGVEPEWIDQIRNDLEIKLILSQRFNATKHDVLEPNYRVETPFATYKVDANSFKLLPIMKTIFLFRGKAVEIVENDSVKFGIEVLSSMIDPIAFEIAGSGHVRPYRSGHVILADAGIEPILSEDILIKTVDNKYFIGEFMYDRESEIEIRTIDDFPEVIQKADIEKTYAIVAFYTSRKKLPIST